MLFFGKKKKKKHVDVIMEEVCHDQLAANLVFSEITDYDRKFHTFLLGCEKDEYVIIAKPLPPYAMRMFHDYPDVEISFYRNNSLLKFSSVFEKVITYQGKENCVKLSYPQEISSADLRSYYRIRLPMDKQVQVILYTPSGEMFTFPAFDLSGGGVSLNLPHELPWLHKDSHLSRLKILLPEATQTINCEGIIRRAKGRSIGIEFDNLKNRDREKIVRFVFQLQIEMQRKIRNKEKYI